MDERPVPPPAPPPGRDCVQVVFLYPFKTEKRGGFFAVYLPCRPGNSTGAKRILVHPRIGLDKPLFVALQGFDPAFAPERDRDGLRDTRMRISGHGPVSFPEF